MGTTDGLVERSDALAVLSAAARAAKAHGRGSTVVVSGDAGIGKTALVRAFCRSVSGRVLAGACDDLRTARPYGPLRDIADGTGGPLETALRSGDRDAAFAGIVAELAGPASTVVVVEDLHWADDATLDVLGFLARRLASMPVVLVVTIRNGGAAEGHPLPRWLGAISGSPVRRIALTGLSGDGVAALAAGTGRDPVRLHELTGGNPFFLTETLAAGPEPGVPDSVTDAVRARVFQLDPPAVQALEQLSVVPGTVEFDLVEALMGDRLAELAQAEERGLLEVRADGVAFRHELARRAVAEGLPVLHRRALHRAVAAALEALPRPDAARLVHHARLAGDADAVLRHATRAADEAVAAGSHREALAHLDAAAVHADRLPPAARAKLLDDHAWELHNAHRFAAALRAGNEAVRLRAGLPDRVALGESQVRVSRYHYLAGDSAAARRAADAAVTVLESAGSAAAIAFATTYRATVLALTGDPTAAAALDQARTQAGTAGRTDLALLCRNYESIARPGIDPDERIALLRESLDGSLDGGHSENAARAYTNLAELLHRFDRLDDLQRCVESGLEFTVDRGFWSHAYNLRVHRGLHALRCGHWAAADAEFTALRQGSDDPGMLRVYLDPAQGRLLARRGDPAAGALLRDAWQIAQHQGTLLALAFSATAMAEWAWLVGDTTVLADVIRVWLPHAHRPSAEPVTAELARYAARSGLPTATLRAALPKGYGVGSLGAGSLGAGSLGAGSLGAGSLGAGSLGARSLGLDGDWRAAAAAWRALGDPYEAALELTGSGDPAAALDGLAVLDELGALPAARIARATLRDLGIRTIPRGPQSSTRTHPAGLTRREAEVLDLLGEGCTNAEIAARLMLSVRTVDHHVSRILDKLGVPNRRQAVRAGSGAELGTAVAGSR